MERRKEREEEGQEEEDGGAGTGKAKETGAREDVKMGGQTLISSSTHRHPSQNPGSKGLRRVWCRHHLQHPQHHHHHH